MQHIMLMADIISLLKAKEGIIMAVFYNQATLSYNGNVAVSNITTGEIIEALSASKNAVTDTYSADSDTVFFISIVNSGSASLDDLTLTDDLGRYTFGETPSEAVPLTYEVGSVSYYVNGIRQAAPAVTAQDPLTITGISVPAGGNAAVIYAARTNQFAPLGPEASITNTVEITGDGIISAVTASSTITPAEGAELSITKSLSPAAVAENGELTYTFIIQNHGSSPASEDDSVIFTDVFDPALDITSVTFNGTPWTQGVNYNYSEASGSFTTLEGQVTVPAAEYSQDPVTGAWSVQPGTSTLVITGNVITSQQNTRNRA